MENKNGWNDQPDIYEWVLMGWWPSLNIHQYIHYHSGDQRKKNNSATIPLRRICRNPGAVCRISPFLMGKSPFLMGKSTISMAFFRSSRSRFMRSLSMPKQASAPSLPMDGDFGRSPGSNGQQLRCHLVQRCLAQSHLCFGRRAPGSPRHHFQRYALVRGGSHHGSVPTLTTIQRAFGLSAPGELHRSLPASPEIHPRSAEVPAVLGAPAAWDRGDPSSQQRSPMRTRKVLNFSAWPQETGHQSLQKHGDRNPPRKLAESSRPHLCESLLPGCSSGWNSKPQGTGHRCWQPPAQFGSMATTQRSPGLQPITRFGRDHPDSGWALQATLWFFSYFSQWLSSTKNNNLSPYQKTTKSSGWLYQFYTSYTFLYYSLIFCWILETTSPSSPCSASPPIPSMRSPGSLLGTRYQSPPPRQISSTRWSGWIRAADFRSRPGLAEKFKLTQKKTKGNKEICLRSIRIIHAYWILLVSTYFNPFGFVWKCCVPHCTQWFCWSLSLQKIAISLGVYPIFRHPHMEISTVVNPCKSRTLLEAFCGHAFWTFWPLSAKVRDFFDKAARQGTARWLCVAQFATRFSVATLGQNVSANGIPLISKNCTIANPRKIEE